MYKYKAYGVGIHSDFKLYNFMENATEADVFIRKIASGLNREEYSKKQQWISYDENRAWVMSDFAQFFISEGKYIDVYVEKEVSETDIAAYICGWGMAFLFTQRGYSAIHCAALEFDDGCVLISGVSGAGKSTTAMELIKRGHRYLVDDIAMINPEDGFVVRPAFPMQKVCRDVADKLSGSKLMYIDADKDKFARDNIEDFCDTAKPLKGIIMLNICDADSIEVIKPNGFDKYLKLFSTLFISTVFPEFGVDRGEKYRMLKVAEKIPFIIISRPLGKDTLGEICDIIEHIFSGVK